MRFVRSTNIKQRSEPPTAYCLLPTGNYSFSLLPFNLLIPYPNASSINIPVPPSIGEGDGPPPTGVVPTPDPLPFSEGFGCVKLKKGNVISSTIMIMDFMLFIANGIFS
jgi:hypothetical protein